MFAMIIVSLSLIITLVAILVFIMMRRRDQQVAQEEFGHLQNLKIIPPEGVRIPVTQTFTGLKSLGAVGISHNNMNPLLKIYDDRIEYRVIIKSSKRYGDIEWIKPVGNRRLRMAFYGSIFSLSVWLTREEDRTTLMNLLRARGVNIIN